MEEAPRLGRDERAQMAWFVIPLVCGGFGVPNGIPGSMLDSVSLVLLSPIIIRPTGEVG